MLKLGKIYMLECMTETVKCCKIYIIRQIIPNIDNDNTFSEEIMSNTYTINLFVGLQFQPVASSTWTWWPLKEITRNEVSISKQYIL